jgi:putative transposase
MSKRPQSHRKGGLPHNPDVRELIADKTKWSTPLEHESAMKGFRAWHERAFLPHRDDLGLIQFVTFRLVDSFPESLRSEWEHLWKTEDESERRLEIEGYLDNGKGECHLRNPPIAEIVENALRFFHGTRYELRAWVIMSNHVHVLFKQQLPLSQIVESWKKHTANKANSLLARRGTFWAPDYFDTFMRGDEHEWKTIRYIENNPTKARLILDPKEWPWSSARFRDNYGRLCL